MRIIAIISSKKVITFIGFKTRIFSIILKNIIFARNIFP
ncbi:MAG: hypothetical protein EU549_03140 [Promethearchaeota archaeon]|nr:MAG: hypothetical protein EU549_03140 [Candidatus Lokiarchaeota archaeon]